MRLAPRIRKGVKSALKRVGYDLRPIHFAPATKLRPFGELSPFLEDIKARGFAPRWILDVGSCRAQWAQAAKAVFPEARFLLIDPLDVHMQKVERFLASAPGSHFLQLGIGSEDTTLEFRAHPASDYSGSSFLEPDVGDPGSATRVQVPVARLDTLLRDGRLQAVPDLIKLDIQGFELEAIEGAGQLMGQTEMFILEVSVLGMHGPNAPTFLDVVHRMKELGYSVYDFPGYHRRPRDGALVQVDIAFVRSDSALIRHQGYL